MTKLVQNDIASLTNEQSALAALNANYALNEVFSDSVLSRDGTSPNEMLADLDMNSNRILNLPTAVSDNEPVILAQINGTSSATLPGLRTRLTADTIYYVRQDGSNSNNGLANTPAGAFLTIQFAYTYVSTRLDFAGFTVTIKVAAGTWTEKVFCDKIHFGGDLIIEGDIVTPGNVIWNATSGDCLLVNRDGAEVDVQGFDFRTTTSGNCLRAAGSSQLAVSGNTTFGACAGAHIYCQYGSKFQTNSNYTINGGAAEHFLAEAGGSIISQGKTVTLSGTPAFSDAFANARDGGHIVSNGNTYSGAGTGVRYKASSDGVIETFGSGATYFPGNAFGFSEGGHKDGHAAAFSAHKNAVDQGTILTATDTKLTFGTEIFDTGSFYDAATSKWVPPAGTYRITAAARWSAGIVDQSSLNIQLRKNNTTFAIHFVQPSGTGNHTSLVTALVQADGDDEFEVYVNGAGAGDKTVSGSIIGTYFCGENISV